MFTDRRSFLAAAVALPACWSNMACAASTEVLLPESFGARGDGRSDDTRALQRCLSVAPPGALVRLRRGAVYRIDTNWEPTRETFGGLKLKSGQLLELNGAELRALPSRHPRGSVLQAYRANGWRIRGPGRITGERDVHAGRGGEWGMGLSVWSSSGWVIEPGLEIANCWGDGLYLGYAAPGQYCEDFLVDRISIADCRRNGIAVIAGRDGRLRSPTIRNISGAAPQGGIDFEPDDPRYPNRAIRVEGGRVSGVEVGIYVAGANEDIVVTGMDIEARNSGIIIGDNATRIRIAGNPSIRSTGGGREGAAIRTVANPALVRSLHIVDNGLSGGGHFVIDMAGTGYRDTQIVGNRITADGRGVQGLARVGSAIFADNIGTIGASAGKAGDYFVHLNQVSHGRNVYRNLSPRPMYAAILNSRDLGGDRFESDSLTRVVQ